MMKRLGIFGLIIVVGCGICGVAGLMGGVRLIETLVGSGRAVGDRANAFMTALRDEKLDDAYAMLLPALQEQESRSAFKEDFTGNSIQDWMFNNFSIKNDLGYVAGTATDADGAHFVAFQLVNEQGTWAISGYNMGALGWVGTVIEPRS